MSKQQTLLFVGAHPDDETFGIGGTLAQYAAAGVNVYYACATRGEAGIAAPEHMRGYNSPGDMRWAELQCASRTLGLTDVIYLGYRDSGMPGSEDNKHPEALAMAPLEQVVGRVIKVIRDLRPEVVITSDPIGGYQHPDHIAIHKATVRAFYIAGNPNTYPEAGSAFNPQKLYFSVFPHRLLKVAVKLMPLFGQDPHHLGRNKDIDIASVAALEFPVHAIVHLSKQAVATRNKAASCYASQLGGRPQRGGLFGFLRRVSGPCDCYMREYPPADSHCHETDLFEGTV
jgi:N-acetyl-1-D-myo-inositol-2-amino-2-deoxy-alpha-D-glucopyranoside deacetylase/mycothiol S-conjugate amidase